MTFSQLPSAMGALLVAAGICLVAYETVKAHQSRQWKKLNSADFSLARWKFQTAYPGITMICVGALLLGVGAFAAH
jgi:hypothetical protein